ncbi:MAG: HAMP domain-containing histidine kinase [Deltaproteobacteria bacterium]|nr:HAMP domain-containing histidine kinase [Deltaproteobacteria bacterium]
MSIQNRLTLRQSLLIVIPALSTICWLALLFVLARGIWREARTTYAASQGQVFESFLRANLTTLQVADYAELRRQLNALALGPDLRHIAIIDAAGEALYADLAQADRFNTLRAQWERLPATTVPVAGVMHRFAGDAGYFVFDLPIRHPATEQSFGRLLAFLSDSAFRKNEARMRWQLLGVGLALLAIQLVVIIRITDYLVAPLERFVREWVSKPGSPAFQTGPPLGLPRDLMELSRAIGAVMAKQATAAAIGRFTAQLAHDMRSPLQVMKIFCGFEGEAERRATIKAAAETSIKRLNDMADELLDYTRASQISKAPCNLAEICAQTIKELQTTTAQRIALVYEGPPALTMACDGQKLIRVVTNIVVNAVQAIAERGTVAVMLVPVERGARISVRDTGCGIRPQHLARIFEPTFTFGKKSGTGLGLDYCKTVVEAHGGEITVASEAGKGTEFVVTLPDALE